MLIMEKVFTIEAWLNTLHKSLDEIKLSSDSLIENINLIREKAYKAWIYLKIIPYEWMSSSLSWWRINSFSHDELISLISWLNKEWISFSLALNWWMLLKKGEFDIKWEKFIKELLVIEFLVESWLRNNLKNCIVVYREDLREQIRYTFWKNSPIIYASSIKLQEISKNKNDQYHSLLGYMLDNFDKVVIDNPHTTIDLLSKYINHIYKFVIFLNATCWMIWIHCHNHLKAFNTKPWWELHQVEFKRLIKCEQKSLAHIDNTDVLKEIIRMWVRDFKMERWTWSLFGPIHNEIQSQRSYLDSFLEAILSLWL